MLLKSGLEDIDKARKWNNENILYGYCPTIKLNQRHSFECPFLIGKKQKCVVHTKI